MKNTSFDSLKTRLKEIATLGSISALVAWDQETYMPEGSINARSEQSMLLSRLIHEAHTSAEFKAMLGDLVDLQSGECLDKGMSDLDQRQLKEMHRDWKLSTCLPSEFVTQWSQARSLSQHAWQQAKTQNAFSDFLPHLKTILSLVKKRAQYIGVKTSVYNTLLDEYEPDMTTQQLDPLFDKLKSEIIPFLSKTKKIPNFNIKKQTWNRDKQREFGLVVLKDMGFDFSIGRQDLSSHPFSSNIHNQDVRITTRYSDHDVLDGLSSSMHEAGHALYEQGLPVEAFGLPLGQANSFGIHESQSRLWENGIGKSKAFWSHYFPILKTYFPTQLEGVTDQAFYEAVTHVEPSLIRVESDEVTYNLHIIIRYELEQALLSDQLAPEDLPKAWNQKYQEYLGLTPPSDTLGVLQDVHWSCGYFGYFPTYTLGNLYAAMLLESLHTQLPNFEGLLSTGQLLPIRNWLKTHIHQNGRCKTPQELIVAATGSPLSEKAFVSMIQSRYSHA